MEQDDGGEEEMEIAEEEKSVKSASMGQNSRRQYLGELRKVHIATLTTFPFILMIVVCVCKPFQPFKVVENADVILHVLDARDPLGTKSTAIEEMVLSNYKKKLVLVLNKADLVPRDVLSGWLAHLRRSAPAVPFKCNTQTGQ